jgi:hypothetical protein
MFVKKIYEEGKAEDPNYEFKQALVDASKRKSEMGNSNVATGVKNRVKKSKRSRSVKRSRGRTASASASAAMAGGKRRRTRRRHRH